MSPQYVPPQRLDPITAAKRLLRREMIARRAELARETQGVATRLAAHFPVADLPPGIKISAYAPMGSEIDPGPLLSRLAARGAVILLPVVTARGGALIFREVGDPATYQPDVVGLRAPAPDAREMRPDLILAPLLAYDRFGGRLGYGGGYYDRTIAALRAERGVRVVGLAYEGQEVDSVPRGAHDQQLDAICTEIGYRTVTPKDS